MPVIHTNRKKDAYYLHQSPTKKGGLKYHFSRSSEGTLTEEIPEGYAIYENLEGQVFLRKAVPCLFTDKERQALQKALPEPTRDRRYRLEIWGDTATVHEAENQMADMFRSEFGGLGSGIFGALMNARPELGAALEASRNARLIDSWESSARYMAVMRVVAQPGGDFIVERFCFRGSVDRWIHIGGPGKLPALIAKFFPHLGKQSLFDLY
jgi:hypothetical protein